MSDDEKYVCPRCGSTQEFRRVEIEQSSAALLFFGGLLPYLLSNANRKNMVLCERCHYVFAPKPAYSLTGCFILLILAAVLVFVIYTYASGR